MRAVEGTVAVLFGRRGSVAPVLLDVSVSAEEPLLPDPFLLPQAVKANIVHRQAPKNIFLIEADYLFGLSLFDWLTPFDRPVPAPLLLPAVSGFAPIVITLLVLSGLAFVLSCIFLDESSMALLPSAALVAVWLLHDASAKPANRHRPKHVFFINNFLIGLIITK
jgi:hypothetical protein